MESKWAALPHDARTVEEFQRRALDLLGSAIGFDIAFLAVAGDESRASGRGVDPGEVLRRFAPGSRYAREHLPTKAAALGRRGVAVDADVLGERVLAKCAYFTEFVKPRGGRHSLLAYLALRSEPFGVLVLGRGGGFSAGEVQEMERILPVLSLGRASYGLPPAEPSLPLPPSGAGARARRFLSRGVLAREARSGGGAVIVRDRGEYREMVAVQGEDELVWSRASLSEPARSGWPYVDLLHVAAPLARRRSRALFVGCGGGVGVRQFVRTYPGIRIDVVDDEPAVIQLATRWYGLGALPGVTTHVADGVAFVAAAPAASWDVVVVDAYGTSIVEERFATGAFFEAVSRALAPGGAVACNVIGSLGGEGIVRRVERSASAVFPSVRLVPVLGPNEVVQADTLRNVVVIAQ